MPPGPDVPARFIRGLRQLVVVNVTMRTEVRRYEQTIHNLPHSVRMSLQLSPLNTNPGYVIMVFRAKFHPIVITFSFTTNKFQHISPTIIGKLRTMVSSHPNI